MEQKLSNKQISAIARIHSAIHLKNADACMFDECKDIPDNDRDKILEAIHEIANKLGKNDPMGLASTAEIVKYVRTKF